MNRLDHHKILSYLPKILTIFCLIIFILSLWASYRTVTHELNMAKSMLIIYVTGTFILLVLIGYIAKKYFSPLQFVVILGVLSFCIRILWITQIPTPVQSDFLIMYNGALHAARGNYAFAQQPYFVTWVYQLGFTMYESLIIRLFGQGTMPLKVLNVLYSTGIVILTYLIASKLFNEWCGRIAGIIYAFNIPNVLYTSVLTNQHLETFLLYLACYLLLTKGLNGKYLWILIGIILSLGDIIRPFGRFFLLVIAIYIIYEGFSGIQKPRAQPYNIINGTKRLVGIVAVFWLVHILVGQLLIAGGVTRYPLADRDPLWKFVLGLNYETSGTYSQADEKSIMGIYNLNQRQHEERKIIQERIRDKKQLLSLFTKKFYLMWGSIDSSGYWSLGPLNRAGLENNLMKFDRFIYITSMLFGIIGLVALITKEQDRRAYTLFLLLIVGYVLLHLLIEIQTRYRFEIIPSFTVIQSYGVYITYKYGQNYVRPLDRTIAAVSQHPERLNGRNG